MSEILQIEEQMFEVEKKRTQDLLRLEVLTKSNKEISMYAK